MAYANDFAIVAEGFTDQVVLTAILQGFYADCDEDIAVAHEQPPDDVTAQASGHAAGGWSLVFNYFRAHKYRQALSFNRYLVVQIDTDVAEDYGVSRQADGKPLGPDELVQAVVTKLCSLIPPAEYEEVRRRLLFAIGVDEIECWLLPLVFDKSEKKKRAKMTGCLNEIDHKRRLQGEPPLDRGRERGKNPDAYRSLAKALTKRKTLNEASALNPGFRHFVEQLEALSFTPERLGAPRPSWRDHARHQGRAASARNLTKPPGGGR